MRKEPPFSTSSNLDDILLEIGTKGLSISFCSSQDWKAQLKLPPPDTRYQTEVLFNNNVSFCHLSDGSTHSCKVLAHDVIFFHVLSIIAFDFPAHHTQISVLED